MSNHPQYQERDNYWGGNYDNQIIQTLIKIDLPVNKERTALTIKIQSVACWNA